MRPKYPMLLDVADRLIVIIGGGEVASRKAAGLIAAGATRIRIIAPVFSGSFDVSVRKIEARYAPEHLEGAQLVFAATDSAAVNQQVVRDARQRGIFVCRADAANPSELPGTSDAACGDLREPGDFVTPAQMWRGPVQVTVSAGSAALAALVRDGIAARWDDGWTALAETMQNVRPRVLAATRLSLEQRRQIFRHLASAAALEIARTSGAQGLLRWLDQHHPGWSGAKEARDAAGDASQDALNSAPDDARADLPGDEL